MARQDHTRLHRLTMIRCVCCGQSGEAVQGVGFRAECWRRLPTKMRTDYLNGRSVKQIRRASRDGQMSCLAFSGGRKR